jgi:hypothetical protein
MNNVSFEFFRHLGCYAAKGGLTGRFGTPYLSHF